VLAELIDVTQTVLALHLTASDGNYAGHLPHADHSHNKIASNPATRKTVGAHEWDHGTSSHARLFSSHVDGHIVVQPRVKR